MAKKKEKKMQFAEESEKTKRAREKLKKKFSELDKKITAHAIEKKTIEIHRWIARHALNRVVLKTKSISLFDENQNAANLSPKIKSIAEKINFDLEDSLKERKKPLSSRSASKLQD